MRIMGIALASAVAVGGALSAAPQASATPVPVAHCDLPNSRDMNHLGTQAAHPRQRYRGGRGQPGAVSDAAGQLGGVGIHGSGILRENRVGRRQSGL